jgi:hypothetical protein
MNEKKKLDDKQQVLSFGPRFQWRENCKALKRRQDTKVSLAVIAPESSDELLDVAELKFILLKSGPKTSRAITCRPYMDDSGDLRLGGENPLYVTDNRCPPKGKFQAYRSVFRDPNRVFKKEVFGSEVDVKNDTLVSHRSGDFYLRVNNGWVQLVVGKFHPVVNGKRTETSMPDVAYAFRIDALTGKNPAVELNILDDNLVDKIVQANDNVASVRGKKMKIAKVTRNTVLAKLHRKARVLVGKPFFDHFPGNAEDSERISQRRPEDALEASVINKMMEFHNEDTTGDPNHWKFNILLKDEEGQLHTHQECRKDAIAVVGDDNGNPHMFLDSKNFNPFWVKMSKGKRVAILPPMPAVATLVMNDIVVSFDAPRKEVNSIRTEAIKPVKV